MGALPETAIREGLTPEEDNELRRLHWLAQFGTLAVRKMERLLELRLRDRRSEIRPPREFEEGKHGRVAVDTASSVFVSLARVRRQLEAMEQSRLVLPFNKDERRKYRELLEVEKGLLDSLPDNPWHSDSGQS